MKKSYKKVMARNEQEFNTVAAFSQFFKALLNEHAPLFAHYAKIVAVTNPTVKHIF